MNSLSDVRDAFTEALSNIDVHPYTYPPSQIDPPSAVPFYRSCSFHQTFGEGFGRMLWSVRISTTASESSTAFAELERLIVDARDAIDGNKQAFSSRGLSAKTEEAEPVERSEYATVNYFTATLLVEVIPS